MIDTKTNLVTSSIDLSPYGPGTGYFMGLTPDGRYLYVPVTITPVDGFLVVVNTATNTVTAPTVLLGHYPTTIAISPNGNTRT